MTAQKIEVLMDHPDGPHVLAPVDDPGKVEDALPIGWTVGNSWSGSPPEAKQPDGRWLLRLERVPMSSDERIAAAFSLRDLEGTQRYSVSRLFGEIERLSEENAKLNDDSNRLAKLVDERLPALETKLVEAVSLSQKAKDEWAKDTAHSAVLLNSALSELHALLIGFIYGDDKPRLRAMKRAAAYLRRNGFESDSRIVEFAEMQDP